MASTRRAVLTRTPGGSLAVRTQLRRKAARLGDPRTVCTRYAYLLGRAVRAATVAPQVTRSVSAGELLVSVPRACVISAEEDPQWGLSLRELLTARLCGALSRGECEAYTQSLPEVEPLLCSEALSRAGRAVWPTGADQAADRPRLAEARGSLPEA